MADYRVSNEQLKSIADAIRQTGRTNQPLRFPDGFTAAIGSLAGGGSGGTDTSDATATAADILDGKSAYVNGEKVIGTFVPDGYQLLTGTLTVSEPTMDLFFEDLPFEPEGAVIYHKAGQNATYGVNGSYLLLFGYGTTENRYNIALSWKSNANKQSALYVDWYEEVLSLTTDGRFNGPYNYMIWGK